MMLLHACLLHGRALAPRSWLLSSELHPYVFLPLSRWHTSSESVLPLRQLARSSKVSVARCAVMFETSP